MWNLRRTVASFRWSYLLCGGRSLRPAVAYTRRDRLRDELEFEWCPQLGGSLLDESGQYRLARLLGEYLYLE